MADEQPTAMSLLKSMVEAIDRHTVEDRHEFYPSRVFEDLPGWLRDAREVIANEGNQS